MEGMLSKHVVGIQRDYWRLHGWTGNSEKWARTLITKLMECTHGQWLYRNVMVHDRWCGTANSLRKEQLLLEIEGQLETGDDLLAEFLRASFEVSKFRRPSWAFPPNRNLTSKLGNEPGGFEPTPTRGSMPIFEGKFRFGGKAQTWPSKLRNFETCPQKFCLEPRP